jgi:nicotinamidase-related amidase
MANALIVVDMLRGFLEEGCPLYCGAGARGIIPNVVRLVKEETRKGSSVFFVADNHAPDDAEFQMFPPHCVSGSEESELIGEFKPFAGVTITKQRYSGFFHTPLEEELARLKPEKVIICGVCTDICVLHTAADARNRDYRVEVPVDGVASFDPQAHAWALEHMRKVLGVKLTRIKDEA